MKIDILILVESKERELESACLLKKELENRNYKVLIKSVYPNKELLPFKYNPKLVITPWAYNNNDMKLFKCFYKNHNTKILNLHHEQYSGENKNNSCVPKDEAKKIFHISWGNEFTKELINAGCNVNSICQSGNIRLDFFDKKFINMSKNKEELSKEFNIDSNKRWILFIANGYHLATERGLTNMCSIDKNARIKAKTSIETRKKFLKYVDRYLAKDDNTVFIYRPHPVYSFLESKQPEIMDLCAKYPGRFICNFSYSIRNWIINVDSILSFHSTAGIECNAAQKNYILFRPVTFDPKIDYEFYREYPYVIKNYEDFITNIQKKEFFTKENVYKNYFDINKDKFTFLLISDFVDRILNTDLTKNRINIKWYIQTLAKMITKEIIILLSKIKLFKKILLNSEDTRVKHIIKNDDDFISKKEIESISDKLSDILGAVK